MTKEELRAHCEKQVKMCEEWAKGNDREPSGKIYEEHKLILDLINELQDKSYELWKESYEEEHLRNIRLEEAIKALEQQSSDDVMAIHTQGLDEGVRCAMCTNSMKSDRGCDGSFRVDEDMYKKVIDTIKNHIFKQPTSEDCVSRQMVKEGMIKYGFRAPDMTVTEFIEDELPPVIPTRKVGKWIRKPIRNEKGGCIGAEMICSYCKKDNEQDKKLAYCPNCGSLMSKEV